MRNKCRKTWKYIFVPGVLFILIFIPVKVYQNFRIQKLIIIDSKDNLKGLDILNGQNLLFLDTQKITTDLLTRNPTVKSVRLIKNFPQTVVVKIENRMPVAQIKSSLNNLFIDADGIILSLENNYRPLPIINAPNMVINPNRKADWRLVKAVSFIVESDKAGIFIDQISLDDAAGLFTAETNSGMEILLPYDSDIGQKASSLQVIVRRFTIVGKNITKVDFRYDKPIVTLGSGEKINSTF